MFFIELIEMFPILLNRTYNIDMQLKHRRRGEKKEKKQRDKNTEKNKQREKKKEGIEMQKIQYTEKSQLIHNSKPQQLIQLLLM